MGDDVLCMIKATAPAKPPSGRHGHPPRRDLHAYHDGIRHRGGDDPHRCCWLWPHGSYAGRHACAGVSHITSWGRKSVCRRLPRVPLTTVSARSSCCGASLTRRFPMSTRHEWLTSSSSQQVGLEGPNLDTGRRRTPMPTHGGTAFVPTRVIRPGPTARETGGGGTTLWSIYSCRPPHVPSGPSRHAPP